MSKEIKKDYSVQSCQNCNLFCNKKCEIENEILECASKDNNDNLKDYWISNEDD